MSLLVWLPLNGSLENKGLTNTKFNTYNSETGLTINEYGNLGGYCYERTAAAANGYRSDRTFLMDGDVSMCCWAFVSSTPGDSANGLITNHNHANGSGFGITVKQISTTDYRISCSEGYGGGSGEKTFHTHYGITNIKNAWHHLGLTFHRASKTLKLYVDGKCEKTVTNLRTSIGGNPFDLFNWSTGYISYADYRPLCKLNDVRLYDECLSQKEMKEISKGLFLHYPFRNEYNASSSFIEDTSGYGYLAESIGGFVSVSEDSKRNVAAGYFNGSTYCKTDTIQTPNNHTISVWLKRITYGYVLDWRFGTTGTQPIYINDKGKLQYFSISAGNEDYFAYTFEPNIWYHLVLVVGTSNVKLYVNGEHKETKVNTINQLQGDLTIGARFEPYNNSLNIPHMYLSDLRIYASHLNDNDIKKLYNAPVELDKVGKLYTYNFTSKNRVNFTKQGTVEFKDFSNLNDSLLTSFGDTLTLEDGSSWAKIHSLDVSSGQPFFANADEAKCCTNMTNRFSRLDIVDQFKIGSVLPKGYTRLDFIQSTGTQYIDTGYYWKHENIEIDFDGVVTSNSSGQSLFGAEEYIAASGNTRNSSGIPHGSSGNFNIYVGDGGKGNVNCGLNTRFNLNIKTTKDKKVTVKLNNNTTALNNTSYGNSTMAKAGAYLTSTASTNVGHIFLFANHNSNRGTTNNATQIIGGAKVYSFKLWDNNKMVRNFIPCKNPDGIVGLYDTIESKFYPGSGGNFTPGNIIPDGYYEFLLKYPNISTTLYNRWKQTGSPHESAPGGYERITTAWRDHAGPLRKANGDAQYNCDNVGSTTWYAAIGQTKGGTNGSIPAANGSQQFKTELWVRIDDGQKKALINGQMKVYEDYLLAYDYIEF